MQTRGQRAHGQGFGQPGHALEENVAIGQQAHDEPLDEELLAHHHLADLGKKRLHPLAAALHLFVQFVR